MRFKGQVIRNVAVFELSGNILGGRGSTALREEIERHTRLGTGNIVLDMAKVSSINAEGQKLLIGNANIVHSAGGRMAVINIHRIESLLAVTKLVTNMEHFESRAEALKELNATEQTELVSY